MKRSLAILTIAALILAAAPHLTCGCGCSTLWQAIGSRHESGGCPHCNKHAPRPSSNDPQPCKCGSCNKLIAATPGPATPSVSLIDHTCIDAVANVESIWTTALHVPNDRKSRAPPGDASHPSAALPILLGHLLF